MVDRFSRVSDWWHYLMEHIGRNATNYFKYLMGRYKRAPRGVCMQSLPPPITPKVHPSPASQSSRCIAPHQ